MKKNLSFLFLLMLILSSVISSCTKENLAPSKPTTEQHAVLDTTTIDTAHSNQRYMSFGYIYWEFNAEMVWYAAYHKTLYRYYNPTTNSYMHTTNFEYWGYGRDGFYKEKEEGWVQTISASWAYPIYSYTNRQTGDCLISFKIEELGHGNNVWIYNGVIGYGFDKQYQYTRKIRRFFNPSTGYHMLSADPNEWIPGYVYESEFFIYAYE